MFPQGSRSRPGDSIPTSSMADIAFLLLVFFLVTTVFPKDKGLAMVLPEIIDVPVPQSNILHFIIAPDGSVEVREGGSRDGVRYAVRDLEGLWRESVAENPLLIAAIRTDPDAHYGHMLDVLDELRSAGAARVSLGVVER